MIHGCLGKIGPCSCDRLHNPTQRLASGETRRIMEKIKILFAGIVQSRITPTSIMKKNDFDKQIFLPKNQTSQPWWSTVTQLDRFSL